jgi:transposase-like protein
MARRPKAVHQLTIPQFEAIFPNEDACRTYLVARRWPEGVRCPRCGNPSVYDLPSRKWHWQCEKCAPNGYRFSHIAGTIFENTNKGLREWFRVVHMMLTSKKGVSALQVKRVMGFGSYETAWSMCHKIRTALMEDVDKLGGIVEVDETYVGGKDKNCHWDKKSHAPGRDGKDKTAVVGAVKCKGNVIARVVDNVKRATLESFISEAVSSRVSLLCTDDFRGYNRLHYRYPHSVINHSEGKDVVKGVVGAIHTQTIEGFWSLVKRGVVGTFHKVSKKYLLLYVAEFEFRHNSRRNNDIFGTAISGC